MKFTELYSKIFEQDGGVPSPSDINVQPAPVAALPAPETFSDGSEGAKTLVDYVTVLDHAVEALNGTDTESLQRLLKSLDKQGTPFEGISDELWSEINRAAESIVGVTTILKSYINLYSSSDSGSSPVEETPENDSISIEA